MNREQEIRKSFNSDHNFWSRKNKDGIVEYYNKNYYNSDYKKITDELLDKIERELRH